MRRCLARAVRTPGARNECLSGGDNDGARGWPRWLPEAGGIAFLAALLAYFLTVSWRKWPDPIIDSGPQWYAAWRIAQGGMPSHEAPWTYGPLSVYLNGRSSKYLGVATFWQREKP